MDNQEKSLMFLFFMYGGLCMIFAASALVWIILEIVNYIVGMGI